MLRPSVFISYKRNDEPTTSLLTMLEASLAGSGFDILRDLTIEPGKLWSNELYTWLMECSGAVALIGKEAARSEWCRREWWFLRERHRSTGLPVIPVSVDGSFDSGGILDDLQGVALTADQMGEVTVKLSGLAAARPSANDYLAAHHAWLRWQYNDAPLWGREPFSLRDVYVETECGVLAWGDIADEKKKRDPFRDNAANGGREDLLGAVVARLSDPAMRELIVVQGPPGCGKSAFTLRLANELLSRGMKPILVRFRDFRLTAFGSADELIEDAIRIGPIDEEPPRPNQAIISNELLNGPLAKGPSRVSEAVFILDGWDEVSLTGNTSYQAQLQAWLPKLRQFFTDRPGPAVRLILTGRPSAEVRGSGALKLATPVMTVRHMVPSALHGFAEAIAAKLGGVGDGDAPDRDWALDLARLKSIFTHYELWFKGGQSADSPSSMEVVGSPLLAFLTFRTLAEWKGDSGELVQNPTALYKALIDVTVQHAGKGRDEGIEGTVHRGGEPLRRLLQKVASVISILHREAVSFTELNYRLHDDPTLKAWCADRGLVGAVEEAARESVLHELVVNFYFKWGNTGIGCEFLHKSFREYLYAEAIVAVLMDVSAGKKGPLEAPSVDYWEDFREGTPQHSAARQLSRLLAPQWLTKEVRDHVVWLIAHEIDRERDRWVWIRDLALDVYIWWAEGVHLRPQPRIERGVRKWTEPFVSELLTDALPFDPQDPAAPARSAALDAHLGEFLMQIVALIHAVLADVPREPDADASLRRKYRSTEKKTQFAPGGGGFFRQLCSRINSAGWRLGPDFPAQALLQQVSFHQEDLSGANLSRADLSSADLSRADLSEAKLSRVNLTGANLTEANLREADLSRADLSRADLRRADLSEAKLSRVRSDRGQSDRGQSTRG